MISTPRNDRTTEPRPPIRLVPPMTTAAIAASSMPDGAVRVGRREPRHLEDRAQAGEQPEIRNVARRIGRGSMPGEPHGLLVGADGHDQPPGDGAREEDLADQHHPTAIRNAGETPSPAIGLRQSSTLGPMYFVSEWVTR